MTAPSIFITGLAGSGSTWALNLFRELGFDAGDPLALSGLNERKGAEWRPLVRLNSEIAAKVQEMYASTALLPVLNAKQVERIASVYEERLLALDCPEIVKIPGIEATAHVLFSVWKPDLVVLMHRPLWDWMRAKLLTNQAQGIPSAAPMLMARAAAGLGMIVDALNQWKVPYRTLQYPAAAVDADIAQAQIGDVVERYLRPKGLSVPGHFEAAHERATRTEWIGWTESHREQLDQELGEGLAAARYRGREV